VQNYVLALCDQIAGDLHIISFCCELPEGSLHHLPGLDMLSIIVFRQGADLQYTKNTMGCEKVLANCLVMRE